ncbi:hypothetical protein JFU47_32135 [Pseudomonas sp. TH39(2020)]|uniref:hypothetical protein n=1 Tax=Pseudomonas sp. TH39(2020) TaxID=2796349 RepID=UPI001911A869|nr:hypothetical protein [Pseudomonas sp. TH39(2020)]MBK5401327.1 hypothetical protein [Pseudomonas sp. TH39(2020)]
MKAYRLVRQSQVLTVLSPADAERMLDTGDYVTAAEKPKARGKDAKRMRGYASGGGSPVGYMQTCGYLPKSSQLFRP